ncbi:MAG: Na+/H+ antiporter subunit E [Candidatus Margulisbacteria bacterium]|nr:Na+/H+ antiporter subunit E [Candidatus Margulisiibacteriota bacterium]
MKFKSLSLINKILITFFFLMFTWLLFTFSLDPFSLLLGVIFSFLIALLTCDYFVQDDGVIQQCHLPRFQYLIPYVFVLLFEIFLGSLFVVYYVITMRIKPGLLKLKTKLNSRFAQVLLANSITLTPGTVTVDIQDQELLVHWLNVKTNEVTQAEKMIKAGFEKWLGRMFY